ncbi:type IV pilin protein [Glaciimonas soli]|uniref:Prepilin-type N-terminal cleavage/methylation domain-containing protein n=1 Tax=Glaciimonas soli TaxID=2590999 RepID=A0A843YUA4_9BURK|nr:type IV pilin protein [Glaciimonas soli]MQR01078.1 prepilin-type N-terminal cleavage/methylation domain-containing protein [Glaciimonas soli]
MKKYRKNERGAKSGAAGFTLFEILIVAVIIALLSAIALPSYRTHIQRGNRAAAAAVLHEAAHWMERRFTMNHSYVNGDGSVPTLPAGINQSPKTGKAIYVINLVAADTGLTTYKLQAVPQKLDNCGTLILDQSGARSMVDATATMEQCWGR